ncbi:hypothetical protein BGCPKDLD_1122 [Methylorubrum suomiense]|uniref:Uncharacterized protein n=2 Tax=Methylobacteriaceae TaxID=119045 RepID=A0ABQ4UQF1_9HYPH|nr:hypothetical protein BGCPKDLD_1122 [Methylorubrum suomiense]
MAIRDGTVYQPAPRGAKPAFRMHSMPTTAETLAPSSTILGKSLQQQVAEAIEDRALPISRLLRLMWALDAERSPANQNLRARLRARIGEPLDA